MRVTSPFRHDWLNSRRPSFKAGTLYARPLCTKVKEDHGISNDITGRLLCPIDYDWDDPEICAKLRDATPEYDFQSSFFLHCLYEGEDGDPRSPQVGFLKGPLLIRAYRHIFTLPSSASIENTRVESSSRRCDVASSLHLNGQVTPRSVAYTATQLVFSLNSSREWRKEHAGFHYPPFYNFIVDYLEDPVNEACKSSVDELLHWWNVYDLFHWHLYMYTMF
ncbi:hypothetical protein BC827DRAFT_1347306 [Russula dissimulans]|nr:hypothetical protein BC827DRAFT_1347306 [Russula dissimulans]